MDGPLGNFQEADGSGIPKKNPKILWSEFFEKYRIGTQIKNDDTMIKIGKFNYCIAKIQNLLFLFYVFLENRGYFEPKV